MAKKIELPFIRVHENMPEHPKVEPLTDKAFRWLVRAMCGSRDGYTDVEALPRQVREELWEAGIMTAAGLLLLHGDWFSGPFRPATGGRPNIPLELRRAVYDRDGYRCVTCGADRPLSLDHIYPWSLGGEDTFENLQTMCMPCNNRKGASV